MDITLIKVIDALLDPKSEKVTRLYLPTIMKRSDVENVTPNMTQSGKLYKNLSVIKTYSGDSHTVVGNYKKISLEIKNTYISKNIGYR